MISGTCPDGHALQWQSQPMIKGMAGGNLLLCELILLCGLELLIYFSDVLNLVMLIEK